MEEGSRGGFGAMVLHLLSETGALDAGGVRVRTLTLPDTYQDHDSPEKMYAEAGLDAKAIVKAALDALPAASGKAEPASNVVSVRRRPR
ncbi:1-deoxy-D-xylulose-5-phosphate synthase [Methylobacterium fujisawaense]|uniref:1-deoxy-D-xylulose-5-phosphate synthase n=1 Tax=Methylobacterium fujisawaense TaxID=107400 RepID=A0ABR6DGJ8_9HYPH|nr:1-deoxy-D-xylulose-5-phosphate synthase [Methylobacterium fujisawaense]